MTKNQAEWASERGQITKIQLSDGCRGENIPMTMKIGYGRSRFKVIWQMSDHLLTSRRYAFGQARKTSRKNVKAMRQAILHVDLAAARARPMAAPRTRPPRLRGDCAKRGTVAKRRADRHLARPIQPACDGNDPPLPRAAWAPGIVRS